MNASPPVSRRLFERLAAGDRAALARAITVVESPGEQGAALHRLTYPLTGKAMIVGFTGPPGAGKSSLIDSYVTAVRRSGRTVAIAAVDPASPLSGGAVLGDRVRMGRHTEDAGVFIRSISSRGHLGGLAENIHRIVDVMDAAGWDVVILETVGAGQSEIEIVELADVRVVVNAPGLGDDIQAIKAGILEIASVLVVNKCDLPKADITQMQLKMMVKLRSPEKEEVRVVATSATSGIGIDELMAEIDRLAQTGRAERQGQRAFRLRRLVARSAARRIGRELMDLCDSRCDALLQQVQTGEIDIEAAAWEALRLAGYRPSESDGW